MLINACLINVDDLSHRLSYTQYDQKKKKNAKNNIGAANVFFDVADRALISDVCSMRWTHPRQNATVLSLVLQGGSLSCYFSVFVDIYSPLSLFYFIRRKLRHSGTQGF